MQIKLLGSGGCKNCIMLEDNVQKAVSEMGISAEVIKITDIKEILAYDITAMPAIVIDEEVVSCGKPLKATEIVKLLERVRA